MIVNYLSIILAPVYDKYYEKKYKTNRLSKDFFLFNKKKINYFSHPYNVTWKHERAIEIPLAFSYLRRFNSSQTLEIGNVTSNYKEVNHTIVDRYEISKGVINKDVEDYKPKKKFKFIFSISTLEHVGVDGYREKGKAVRAINYLAGLLSPKGILMFTIPMGYNKILDRSILTGKLKLDEVYYFKKISSDNKWKQVGKKDISRCVYGFPYHWGNAIIVGIIKK